jgi:hypothetical protein
VIGVTHEAVFDAVMREVDVASAERGGPAAAERVVAGLLDETEEHSAILRQLDLLRRNETAHEIPFTTLRDRVREHVVLPKIEEFARGGPPCAR